MLRSTVARLYASSKPPAPSTLSIAGPSTSTPAPSVLAKAPPPPPPSETTTHGRWGKPHVHNPYYKKQASLAMARSRPLAVRLRRAQRYAQDIRLPPSTDKKPARRLKLDEFLRRDEEKPKNIPIPRIRGMTVAYHNGKPYTVKVEGKKVYLPNIIFRLMRNYTPPGQPYNPWQATFRISKNLTKTDIRGYLMAVYGVQTTYIRTDNYRAELSRNKLVPNNHSNASIASYKRAVVGLVEPFYYPLRLEDMEAERRERREAELEAKLQIKISRELLALNQQNQRLSLIMPKSWHQNSYWTTDLKPARRNILRRVAEQRMRRETLVGQQVDKWRQQRAAGESISLNRKVGVKRDVTPQKSSVPGVVIDTSK